MAEEGTEAPAPEIDEQWIEEMSERVGAQAELLHQVNEEVRKAVIGQHHLVENLVIGLLTGGHVLLEGVPGLAKTTTVKALADSMHAKFSRIQFTPDLLPADLIGTLIYNPHEGKYSTKLGPIFANIVLADEINRAPAKVQSALLEAMQEHQVTIGDTSYALDEPFLVLATENPIEQEGTYQLPEAQVDRFMIKVTVDYPSRDEEKLILDLLAGDAPGEKPTPVLEIQHIEAMRAIVDQIYVSEEIRYYIVDLVMCSRYPERYDAESLKPLIRFGASPRATINLAKAAKAYAFLCGRPYVTPHDVKTVAPQIMGHRVMTTYEAEAEDVTSDKLVEKILNTVPVP